MSNPKPFTFEDREQLLSDLYTKLRKLLIEKGKEYSQDHPDSLNNFTSRSNWLGLSRKSILFVDLAKHLDAIKQWAIDDKNLTIEQAENRMIDALVYLILLIAIYRQETYDKEPNDKEIPF